MPCHVPAAAPGHLRKDGAMARDPERRCIVQTMQNLPIRHQSFPKHLSAEDALFLAPEALGGTAVEFCLSDRETITVFSKVDFYVMDDGDISISPERGHRLKVTLNAKGELPFEAVFQKDVALIVVSKSGQRLQIEGQSGNLGKVSCCRAGEFD